MAFGLNQVIGKYECLAIIDKPKVGVTYKVRNLDTGEIELLRALPGASTREPEAAERLLREIRIQTRLSHPNIIEFHDAFEIDGCLMMTTEFVEAPTLADLCRKGALSVPDAIQTVTQVLDALEQAHALGIVHRGITAEHVNIAPEGIVKLSGFDLAKPAGDMNLTLIGTVGGNPRYMSPEQVMGQPGLDARSDLYAVGVLLYQALTGKLPFDASNDIDIMTAQVRSDPAAPSNVNPVLSSELDRVVLTALKKNRAQRFASAKEFRDALAGAQFARGPVTLAKNDAIPVLPESDREPQRRFSMSLAGVIIALAIGALIVWRTVH